MRAAALLVALLTPLPAAAQSVFFGNLHSHTSYSDGSDTPREAYAHARDVAELDFLAITEHNHMDIRSDPALYNGNAATSLIRRASQFTNSGSFIALFGQEFSTISSGNHANVFEVEQVVDVESGRWDLFLDTWLPTNLDASGQVPLVLLNHPATSSSSNSREYGVDDFPSESAWRQSLDQRAQLINLINGPSHQVGGEPGRPSESEFLRYLNLGFHLGPTADQDNHRPNWGSAADTRTGVVATQLTRTELMTALRARRTYATQDRNLRIIPRVNGHLLGSVVTAVPAAGSALSIELEISDDDEPDARYVIETFVDEVGGPMADVVTTTNATGDGTVQVMGITYGGGNEYVFFRISQFPADDDAEPDMAWTAPVWFEAGSGAPALSVSLVVDEEAETAVITNLSAFALDMSGWTLTSTVGSQVFRLSQGFSLGPGASVTIVSGRDAVDDPPERLLWTRNWIWNNGGDPGVLRDEDGNTVATSN